MAKKFIRKDAHKKKRLQLVWRKPKGITNKRRLARNGHARCVRAGFGTKNSERGKTNQGLRIIYVATLEQLKKINPKTEAALLAGVGKKRKTELMDEAEKLKITLVNFNSKKYKEKAEKFLAEKKSESQKRKDEAKSRKEEEKKNKKEEDQKEEAISEEDKKKQEKEEKDKILTKK